MNLEIDNELIQEALKLGGHHSKRTILLFLVDFLFNKYYITNQVGNSFRRL